MKTRTLDVDSELAENIIRIYGKPLKCAVCQIVMNRVAPLPESKR